MKPIEGIFTLDKHPISKKEDLILLSIFNVVNDQGFDEWLYRGASRVWFFEEWGKYIDSYVFWFRGCELKIVVKLDENFNAFRFYFVFGDNEDIVPFSEVDSWEKIDNWVNQKH